MNLIIQLKTKLFTSLKYHSRVYLIIIVILFVFENIVLVYDNVQNKKPIIGLKLENHVLTNLSRQQIFQIIQQEKQKRGKSLRLTDGSKIYTLNQADIHYSVDEAIIINQLLTVGRNGNLLQKFITQQAALLGLVNVSLLGMYSKSLLLVHMLEIQEEFNQNPQPETLDFVHNMQTIIPAKDGVKIQPNKLALLIVNNIGDPPRTPIAVPLTVSHAKYYASSELNTIRNQAELFVRHSITLSAAGRTLTITPAEIKGMLTVVERPDPKNPQDTYLVLHIDDEKLNQKLDSFAAKVDELTHTSFDDEQAKLLLFAQLFQPTASSTPPILQTNNQLASVFVLGAKTQSFTKNKMRTTISTITTPPSKIAYLTFDDGPNAIYHPLILDILKTYHIHATFFLIGQNALNDQFDAKRTAAEGHVIGNHSFTHPDLIYLSIPAITYELTHTNQILKVIDNNQEVTLFRPPYGAYNNTVTNIANTNNLNEFLWNVDPRDWAEPPTDELVNRVISATHDGSTVLMHSNHLATVKALPKILDTLISERYTFQTLDKYPTKEELWP